MRGPTVTSLYSHRTGLNFQSLARKPRALPFFNSPALLSSPQLTLVQILSQNQEEEEEEEEEREREGMGRNEMGEETMEAKARLVREVCTIASTFSSCTHSRRSLRNPAFVDWYLILGVDEDAGADAIRRRYRQLALQLHPDKNKHPKAEDAFKLVSKAYECLSDKGRREAFNAQRWSNFCKECHRKLQTSAAPKNGVDKRDLKSHRILKALKEFQSRLREECRVIKKCLRPNAALRQESPLFDPSDQLMFPEYPHGRARVVEKQTESWHFNTSNAQSYCRREAQCESPIYQVRSEIRESRARTPGF